MRADRAAAELGAVDDEVVGARAQRARVGEVELGRRRAAGAGAVNGWCIAVQRALGSSYSNIGKSTTQSTSWRAWSISPKRSPSSSRSAPSACAATARAVGDEQQQVAVAGARASALTAAICSALKNFARLPRQPPSPTAIGATALAP